MLSSRRFGALRTAAFLISLVLAALLGCVSCSSSAPNDGIAATMYDEVISEQQVTDDIQSFRASSSLSDNQAWAAFLGAKEMSASDFRTTTIRELAASIVIRREASKLGLTVDEAAVENQIDGMKGSLLISDDETWSEALSQYGTTESELRDDFADKNLQSQVYEKLVDRITPSDSEIADYIGKNLSGQTAKKLVRIYGSDYNRMQDALAELTAAPSAGEGIEQLRLQADGENIVVDDYGWYLDGNASNAMETKINSLAVGEATDELLPDSGIYQILYVEDEYAFPATGELAEDIPDELKQRISSAAEPDLWDAACSAWLADQIDSNIDMRKMPQGLPYDVDSGQ